MNGLGRPQDDVRWHVCVPAIHVLIGGAELDQRPMPGMNISLEV